MSRTKPTNGQPPAKASRTRKTASKSATDPAASAPSPKRRKLKRPPANFASLVATGRSFNDIADELGADREAVARWARLPRIEAEVARIEREASDTTARELAGMQGDALAGLRYVLKLRNARAAPAVVKASEAVLDRTGHPKRTALEVTEGPDADLDQRTDEELDAEVLEAAVAICIERGRTDLAEGLRELLDSRAQRPITH